MTGIIRLRAGAGRSAKEGVAIQERLPGGGDPA